MADPVSKGGARPGAERPPSAQRAAARALRRIQDAALAELERRALGGSVNALRLLREMAAGQ